MIEMRFLNKKFIIFIGVFFLFFFFTYICMPPFCDEIWSYGFSYNISKGMVIYRDFNVLQTPLYFFVGSIFIKIFGNYMISLGILNSILVALIAVMLYEMGNSKKIYLILLLSLFYPSSYNLMLVFFMILIIYLMNKNEKTDILLAFIIGLMFLTKQSIGIVMMVPYLVYSKRRLKGLCTFLLPCLFLLIYLVYNNALFSFVDYAFFGLFDFSSKNTVIYVVTLLFEFIVCSYLIYVLFKSRFKNKVAFYILAFQIISYPIFDVRHFICSMFVFLCWYCRSNPSRIFNSLVLGVKCGVFISYVLFIIGTLLDDFSIHTEKDLFYLKNASEFTYRLDYLYNYLEKKDYDYVSASYYFTDLYGYAFKLYYDVPVNQYDFMISGNLGFFTKEKRFKEIEDNCKENKCIFFIEDSYGLKGNQWSEFALWVINRYEKEDSFYTMKVYSNEDMLEE